MRLQFVVLSLHFLRILGYKTCFYCRQCWAPIAEMSLLTSLSASAQSLLASLSSYWGQTGRSRKMLAGLVLLVLLLLYIWPSWLRRNTQVIFDPIETCVESKLQPFRPAADNFDLVIGHNPWKDEDKKYLPYVGNGYIGVAAESMSMLYVRSQRSLSLAVKYYPILQVTIPGLPSKEGYAIDFTNGLVHRIQCFQMDSQCVTVASQTYAHRTKPSLLVQDFRLYNPTSSPVSVDLDLTGQSDWAGAQGQTKKLNLNGETIEYSITTGTVQALDGFVYPIAIATTKPPMSASILAGMTWKYRSVTAVKYLDQMVDSSSPALAKQKAALNKAAENELQAALNTASKYLRQEHALTWQKLWSSGFGISLSRAKDALNGDGINSTIYYVLSNMGAPLHEQGRTVSEKNVLEKLLYFPDRCYEGHHTLQNSKMWLKVQTMENLISMVNTWLLTLEKKGCHSMLRAGADGAIQAMILSFGELQFKNDHLEFHVHPRDLHRDYYFRRINYGNNTHVNITVLVNADNKAELYVAMDKNDKQYYACDAGCVDAPVQLRNEKVQFPVKLTEPWTSVLYITSDKQHMVELKHTIHVKEIFEAPAHEHHVIALHRHGHHYGGLPMMFWVSIGFLILTFHLFLFKLILNEYCQSDSKYSRGRYNL